MLWKDEARHAVEACIKEVLAQADGESRACVKKFGALPVFRGWDGDSLLAPDGNVLCVEDGQLVPWSEATWTFYIYVKAARKYPSLQAILPRRQPGHATCPDCLGSGQLEKHPSFDCGTCLGLGWIYPEMPKAAER